MKQHKTRTNISVAKIINWLSTSAYEVLLYGERGIGDVLNINTSAGRCGQADSTLLCIIGGPSAWIVQASAAHSTCCMTETRGAFLPPSLTHSWSWALVEKLPIVQPFKNSPAFYETRRFITAFTRALHWSLSWARSIQSIPSILSL
jgi:hypothetical protein